MSFLTLFCQWAYEPSPLLKFFNEILCIFRKFIWECYKKIGESIATLLRHTTSVQVCSFHAVLFLKYDHLFRKKQFVKKIELYGKIIRKENFVDPVNLEYPRIIHFVQTIPKRTGIVVG